MNEESIFAEALEKCDPRQRATFLDRACNGSPTLRQNVEALLAAYAVGEFLEAPVRLTDATAPMLPRHEQPGTQIGPYKLLEQIGEGGMGVVYMAEQQHPVRRKVALKIIKPGMDTRHVIARFEAERQALALMDHPNIARILDAGTTGGRSQGSAFGSQESETGNGRDPHGQQPTPDSRPLTPDPWPLPADSCLLTPDLGRPYFVMELVRGIPITDYCNQERLTCRQRLELFVDVCRAVQHAHQKGIIHRDLKPSNVLVTMQDGRPLVKVIDFGVAKAMGQQLTEKTLFTGFAQLIGTPLYMSPEQAALSAADVDTRSDIYSLGVLLYELLTGTTPFDKETLARAAYDEIRRMIREDEPPRPSARISTLKPNTLTVLAGRQQIEHQKLCRQLRGELDWIVMKALDKDRNRRYESASAFATDVQHYLNDEPVEASPPSAVYRLRKLARRNKAALTTAAIVVLTMLAATGVSLWSAFDAHKARQLADDRLVLANQRQKQSEADFQRAQEAVHTMLTQVAAPEHQLAATPEFEQVRKQLIDDALAFYKELLRAHPNDPTLRFRMAEAHHAAGDVYGFLDRRGDKQLHGAEAFDLLSQLVKDHPERPDYRYRLGKVMLMNLAFDADGSTLPDIVSLFEKLLAETTDPHEQALYHKEAACAYNHLGQKVQGHDATQAKQYFQQACSHAADAVDSQDVLGVTYLALGDLAHTEGDKAEAELQWRNAIQALGEFAAKKPTYWPRRNLAIANQQLGTLLDETGRKQEAESLLREAVAISVKLGVDFPSSYAACNPWTVEPCVLALGQCVQPHDSRAKAVELLDELIQQYPRLLVLHYVRAQQFAAQGNTEKALAEFTAGAASLSKTWDYYYYRAVFLSDLGRAGAALEEIDRSLELNPRQPKPRTLRGDLYMRRKKYSLAIDDYEVAVDSNPGHASNSRRRGWALVNARRYPEALIDLKHALRIQPTNLATLTWDCLGKVVHSPDAAFRKGFLDLADEAVRLNHHSAESLCVRSVILAEFGQFEQAREGLLGVIARGEGNFYTRYQAALLALKLDDPAAYRGTCAALVTKFADSQNPNELYYTAWTCSLGPGAVEDHAPVLELARRDAEARPSHAGALQALGAALFRAGQFEEAREALTKAADAAPPTANSFSVYTRFFLAMTHHRLGQHEEAQAWFDKAEAYTEQALAEKDGSASLSWNRRLTLELLQSEAAALLQQP